MFASGNTENTSERGRVNNEKRIPKDDDYHGGEASAVLAKTEPPVGRQKCLG